MREHATRWILCSALAAAAWLAATPASAQFEEPDTVPRWAIGPLIEATFRGNRGTQADPASTVMDPNVDFSDGPAFGARLERRLGRTVSLGVLASYARSSEKFDAGGGNTIERGDLTLLNLAGELAFKVKPQVPGYFVFGGGLRFVSPDEGNRFGRTDDYVEPMAVVGLGLEAFRRRIGVLRAYGRLYITATADQGSGFGETNSLSTDFALGLSYHFRF